MKLTIIVTIIITCLFIQPVKRILDSQVIRWAVNELLKYFGIGISCVIVLGFPIYLAIKFLQEITLILC